MKRTIVFLSDGRARVAELENGRVRVSSLVAWMSAHPGRSGLRALAGEPQQAPAAWQVASARRGWRAAFVSFLG